MGVSFITFGNVTQGPDGRLTSDTASARYRILLPGEQLVRRGHNVQVHTANETFWREGRYASVAGEVVVFSKSFDPRNEQLAEALKKAGRKVVFDVCDNHFDHVKHGRHFRRMVDLADQLIVSTEAMAEVVRSNTSREACVIGDPVEGRRGIPRFAPRTGKIDIAWFGHPVNLDTVAAVLPDLRALARQLTVRVNVVTAAVPGLAETIAEWNALDPGHLSFSLRRWTVTEVEQSLERCDLAMIPSLANDRKSVKSPNRLLETIWAGRLAVAYPLPSYLEFGSFARIGLGLRKGILDAIDNSSGEEARILAGQRYIAKCYLPFQIAEAWESALFATRCPILFRLNVCCDGRHLHDCVNVQDTTMPNAARADVVCNVVELEPFANESVDDVLVTAAELCLGQAGPAAAVAGWTRILKPGGSLAIEFGNSETLPPAAVSSAMRQAGLLEIREESLHSRTDDGVTARIVGARPTGSATIARHDLYSGGLPR